ncbi:MAG: hypothetical protein PHW75_01010 [Patescibacteria group bacterium]|nr:hypothetical protein [Patescibacteria group bacterium]
METLKSKEVDWKKIAVVAALVALTALVVGVLIWYYKGQEVLTQAEYYEKELYNKNIELLKSGSQTGEGCDTATTLEECETVIAYERAGLFEGNEKTDIETKIVEPYIYYANNVESSSRVVAVVVDKYPADERPSNYWFSITAVHQNGGTTGWLVGENGTISYWAPECMDTCTLTQAFVDKYPNNLPTDYEVK